MTKEGRERAARIKKRRESSMHAKREELKASFLKKQVVLGFNTDTSIIIPNVSAFVSACLSCSYRMRSQLKKMRDAAKSSRAS